LLLVDTPAGAVDDVREAVAFADFAILVVRPTLLDLAGLAPTLRLVRRLGAPHIVVVNQAPVPRQSVETPLVRRSLLALDYLEAPVAPVILRSRFAYQAALDSGRSAEDLADPAAALEIAGLWKVLEMGLAANAPAVRRA
jgi:chromosome partitioning protein